MFKVGDIVVALDTSGSSPSSYIKGHKYRVTKLYTLGGIDTECVLTGATNGWSTQFFRRVHSERKLPEWW